MPMVVSAAAATAAADGAPRGTVCTDGAATAQDPSRSFIATPAAVAFRPPGQPALRPSVRPAKSGRIQRGRWKSKSTARHRRLTWVETSAEE